jgi:ComF family protein
MESLGQLVKDFTNTALGLIYPEVCQMCGEERAGRRESYLCEKCTRAVRHIQAPFCQRCGFAFDGSITTPFECSKCREADWAFSYARSAVIARDPVLEVIHRYKYQHAMWFEPFLAQLLINRAGPEIAGWDCLVPVPLHPTKQREREFNQAERLAVCLSRATGVPVNTRLIRRRVATRTQTLLTREERQENMRRAFAARGRGARLNGERIIVIDDVFTTGATTGACAKVLRAMGAGEVCVWTVARGI